MILYILFTIEVTTLLIQEQRLYPIVHVDDDEVLLVLSLDLFRLDRLLELERDLAVVVDDPPLLVDLRMLGLQRLFLSSLLQSHLVSFLFQLMLLLQSSFFGFFHSNPLHLLFLSCQLFNYLLLSPPLLDLEASLISFDYALFAQGLLWDCIVLCKRIVAIRTEQQIFIDALLLVLGKTVRFSQLLKFLLRYRIGDLLYCR